METGDLFIAFAGGHSRTEEERPPAPASRDRRLRLHVDVTRWAILGADAASLAELEVESTALPRPELDHRRVWAEVHGNAQRQRGPFASSDVAETAQLLGTDVALDAHAESQINSQAKDRIDLLRQHGLGQPVVGNAPPQRTSGLRGRVEHRDGVAGAGQMKRTCVFFLTLITLVMRTP